MNPARAAVLTTAVLTIAVLAAAALPVAAQTAKPAPAAKPVPAAQAADPAAALPDPVLAAFRKSYPNATIKNASKETEDGKTVWEVESTENGLGRDLVYNPDGTVVEVEEEIAASAAPAAVSAALKAKYPKGIVTKVEKRTAGKSVTYEFTLTGASVTSAEFTSDGKLVPAKKDKDEKDEDDEKAEKKVPKK